MVSVPRITDTDTGIGIGPPSLYSTMLFDKYPCKNS